MSTASTLQQTRAGLISKDTEHPKRKIIKLFYSEATWKLHSGKELNEKEINEVIRRIGDFYTRFFKEKKKELDSFGFELDFDRDCAEFKLTVKLSSADYIPTNAFAPPIVELPMDQLSPDNVKLTHAAAKKASANGSPSPKGGSGSTSVDPTLQNITVKAFDSAPTQNTGSGGKTPPPIQD